MEEEVASPGDGDNAMFSNSIDRLKESFLLATAQGGSAQDCESLLKLGADVNFIGPDNETPLLGAVRRGHIQAAEVLLVHGADCNASGQDTMTPLHVAAKRGDMSLLNVLLHAAANPNAKTADGKTPFDLARSKGYEDVCSRLLEFKRNPGGVSGRSFRSSPSSSLSLSSSSQRQRQQQQDERHFDLEAATLRSPRRPAADAKTSLSSPPPGESNSNRSDGLQLIGDQFPSVAPAKQRPASSRRPGTSSLEEKRADEVAARAAGGDSTSTVAIHNDKLVEHASRVYRDEKEERDRNSASETHMMDATRTLLETEFRLQETEQKLQLTEDENTANQIRIEEIMIDLAVSNKESDSLKEQFFKMKEYLQQLNEEMGLLRGESSAVREITSIGECERLEKIMKGTLGRLEDHKSELIAKQLSKTQDEHKMCVVCQDAEKSVLLLPCRHVCVCKGCARNEQLDTCPLCRETIVDRINVFM